jgi:hypothetical protein
MSPTRSARRRFRAGALLVALIAATYALALPSPLLAAPPAAQVMSWVPPYRLEQSRQALQHRAGKITADQWLTRMGLQFWMPMEDGGLRYATHEEKVDDAQVAWFRSWARERGVKVLLTVYNYDGTKWNWELARAAFKDHRDIFVARLVAEVVRLKLDGVDIDLEGNGSMEDDRTAFASFVSELSTRLRAHGKLLTIDSFHSPCFNAPHMAWWKDWAGQVDAIHSMGYGDLYEGSTQTFTPEGGHDACMNGEPIFRFSWQTNWGKAQGYKPAQLLLGFPGGRYEWGEGGTGRTLADHLTEVAAQGAGICIWDIPSTLGMDNDARWGSEAAWAALKRFRNQSGTPAGAASK